MGYKSTMDIPFTVRASRDMEGFVRVRYGIALWYRLATAGIFFGIVATVIAAGGTGYLGYIALALSAVAAAWNESWVFDSGRKLVTGGAGITSLYKPLILSFDEIDQIELVEFHRGSFSGIGADSSPIGAQARLVLVLKECPNVVLNSVNLKNKASLQRDAFLLSELTGLIIKSK